MTAPRGLKGFVSDGIRQALAAHADIDEVVAIGPPVMMKACAETTRPLGIKTMVSLNPIMVDGTGMCGGCRVKLGDEVKFACVDGPDFDGHLVDFDDMMRRLRRYAEEEKAATERWSDTCRMTSHAADAVTRHAGDPRRRHSHRTFGYDAAARLTPRWPVLNLPGMQYGNGEEADDPHDPAAAHAGPRAGPRRAGA